MLSPAQSNTIDAMMTLMQAAEKLFNDPLGPKLVSMAIGMGKSFGGVNAEPRSAVVGGVEIGSAQPKASPKGLKRLKIETAKAILREYQSGVPRRASEDVVIATTVFPKGLGESRSGGDTKHRTLIQRVVAEIRHRLHRNGLLQKHGGSGRFAGMSLALERLADLGKLLQDDESMWQVIR
jgi:hypothetical protein